jgi:hypothetical protein
METKHIPILSNQELQWKRQNRLEASAPDLLEALEFLLADYIAVNGPERTGSDYPADKARAAIAKAKGEASRRVA